MAVTITPCVAIHLNSLRNENSRFGWDRHFIDETAELMENKKSIAKNSIIFFTSTTTAFTIATNQCLYGNGTGLTNIGYTNVIDKPTNFQSDWNSTVINKPTNFQSEQQLSINQPIFNLIGIQQLLINQF